MASNNSNQIKKLPPFLELSNDTINFLASTDLELEDVVSVWTGLIKCSNLIKTGKRLENISWRIVNRNLIRQDDTEKQKEKNHEKQHDKVGIPKVNSKLNNKLNNGDFASLLSIVTNQNEIRPKLIRKRSSNKNVLKYKNNKSVESMNGNNTRPSMSRKSSSFKNVKGGGGGSSNSINNTHHSHSTAAAPHPVEIDDSRFYEQPEPKFAFGHTYNVNNGHTPVTTSLMNNSVSHAQSMEDPSMLKRSTSVVRGFTPHSTAHIATSTTSMTGTGAHGNNHHNNNNSSSHSHHHSNHSSNNNSNGSTATQPSSLFHRTKPKKNMFFIESSPSPTEAPPVRFIDSITERDTDGGKAKEEGRSLFKPATNRNSSLFKKEDSEDRSLFGNKQLKGELIFSSDDSFSDESDWSSVSDSDREDLDDSEYKKQWKRTEFKRGEKVLPRPSVKRSLLSGMFLNELPKQEAQSQPHIKHKDNLEIAHPPISASISTTNVNATGFVNEQHDVDIKSKLAVQESSSPSLTQLISKSALNLSNYFSGGGAGSNGRKNSFSSIASDRARQKFRQESNAPPTASTLLPTALSTHMFVPNVHQRAKSKLTSVQENNESNETSRKNSEPVIEVPKLRSQTVSATNISRKLSPKTTRRQMLATELSDSLRQSILTDRLTKSKIVDKRDEKEDTLELKEKDQVPAAAPRVLKVDGEPKPDDWDEDEGDFYTRGW